MKCQVYRICGREEMGMLASENISLEQAMACKFIYCWFMFTKWRSSINFGTNILKMLNLNIIAVGVIKDRVAKPTGDT